jgi:integrase
MNPSRLHANAASPTAWHGARLSALRWRSSRPTAALAGSSRSLDPATVKTLLGHSKITTTERYLHARPLVELAERMDAMFDVAPTVDEQPVR